MENKADMEKKIRERINYLETCTQGKTLLERKAQSAFINAPVAIMQASWIMTLSELYALLGEKRPRYPYDDN